MRLSNTQSHQMGNPCVPERKNVSGTKPCAVPKKGGAMKAEGWGVGGGLYWIQIPSVPHRGYPWKGRCKFPLLSTSLRNFFGPKIFWSRVALPSPLAYTFLTGSRDRQQ